MSKKRSSTLLLIPVLFLFACQPTDLDGVGVTQEDTRTMQTVELNKTRDIDGYSSYKQLSIIESVGVNTLTGVSLENLRRSSLSLEYPIIKEMIDGINSTSDKSVKYINETDVVKSTRMSGDNGKRGLTYSLIDDDAIYDLTYTRTFDNLEDFEATKKNFDNFIITSEVDYKTKEVIIESPSLLNPLTYQVHSNDVKHFITNATNDSYGRYVLNIRYIVSTDIEYYLKSEHPSSLKEEGVLSIDSSGQYNKTPVTTRLTEDFIPQLSETLGITLGDYLIEDEGVVQESTFFNDFYEVEVLSENGYVVYAKINFLDNSLSYKEYQDSITTIKTSLKLQEVSKITYDNRKEITKYTDKTDALVEERVFTKDGINRLYFMNLAESDNFIEYQLLRGLGSTYMNYR